MSEPTTEAGRYPGDLPISHRIAYDDGYAAALTALRAEVAGGHVDTDRHHDPHCSCMYDGLAIEQSAVLTAIDKALR
jgi:hypothetical protein